MKRLFSIIALLLLIGLLFSGCGGGGSGSVENDQQEQSYSDRKSVV